LEKEVLKSADDLELVEFAMSGNAIAFKVIVERYESMIANITISMVGNSDDADDIGQETFIRFYKSMNKFKGESQLGTYIARIAINLTLNHLKKRSRRWLFTTGNYADIETPSSESEESNDIVNVVNASLKKIEPKFRSVIVLRHIQGFSTKETAKILSLPEGTVLSRLSRGRSKLKEIITKFDIL
jgi:RNA polymerase sigma-70 factor, ECF subfamily